MESRAEHNGVKLHATSMGDERKGVNPLRHNSAVGHDVRSAGRNDSSLRRLQILFKPHVWLRLQPPGKIFLFCLGDLRGLGVRPQVNLS